MASQKLVSGFQLPQTTTGRNRCLARQGVGLSPHPAASSTAHPFVHKAVFYAEAHMYLNGLLWDQLRDSIGVKRLREFGLLEFGPLRYSRPSVAVLIPPFVASLAPSALETVLAPREQGRSV